MKEREDWREDYREPFWLGEPSGWTLALLRLGILKEKHILGVMEMEFWTRWGWGGCQRKVYSEPLKSRVQLGWLRWQEARRGWSS